MNQDSYFKRNVKQAKKAGVSIGIYYYASATTKAEAKKDDSRAKAEAEGPALASDQETMDDFSEFL